MTINSEIRKVGPFIGNGTATAFPFTFKVFQASDLEVVKLDVATNVETGLTLTTDYTVTLNADQDSNPGGTVTLVGGALASGYTLTLTSDVPYLQPTDLTNQGGFYPDVINDSLDRATIQIQQLEVGVNRSLKVPVSSTANTELPDPSANELIGWNSTGDGLTNIDPGSLATIVAYATAYADTFEGDGTTNDWTLTRNPGTLYNLDVSINGVTQVPVTDYTLVGTTFSTTTPAPVNSVILVKYKEGLASLGEVDSQNVRYVPLSGSDTNVQTRLRAYESSEGADYVGFAQSGTGAVTTNSVQDKLRQTISVDDFIPVGTDIATANCTAYVQAAINEAASKGVWLTGNNKTYLVSTVNMLTGQRIRDLNLSSIGPLSAGAVSMQPVVWINGVSSVKSDMIFDNVRVNGRRQLFTNIDLTGGGQGEDGGMHCWRVSGGESGGVSNITWINCEGTYAGTAGLAIHCNDPSTSTATYKIKNLKWVGGKLTYNREHGFFADSFDGLQVIDCDCSFNGIDLNTSDSLNHGNRGARSGGKLFGAGFDLETYTGYNGSLWTRFYARNLKCTNSAMPSLLYNPIATDVAGYVAPKDIKISDCTFDKGSATGSDRSANTDYSFYALGNYTSSGYPYIGIAMNNNRFLQEAPQFNGVTELSVTGGYIESSTYKAHVYNCFGWDVSANGLSNKIDLYPTVSFTFTKTQGTAGASISANTTEYVSSKTGGNDMYRVALTITGGLAAGGDLIYTTVSPISGRYITEAYVSAKSISGTKAIISCSEVDPVSGVAAFNFSTVDNDNIYAELYIVLASSA